MHVPCGPSCAREGPQPTNMYQLLARYVDQQDGTVEYN